MRRLLIAALVALVLMVVSGGLLFRAALRHGFSAREKPWAIEAFVARNVRRLATGSAARSRINPLEPTPEILAEARDHFADHCATCHANDGSGKTPINEGLYPPATDLRDDGTQRLADGELMEIIRNGIRFTGMPGWGGEDDENWKLVLFLRHLPKLSKEELRMMDEIQERSSSEKGVRHEH